jgi:tetratricopeptide (TPR) repeat protein
MIQRSFIGYPDLAAVVYELAKLNFNHEIQHTPAVQMVYDTLGRGSQVYIFYNCALDIRKAALGEENVAYAQSLYGLATMYKVNQKTEEALAMLHQALEIQLNSFDPLPSALTMLSISDIEASIGEVTRAIDHYQAALELLVLPSKHLSMLQEAARYCEQATVHSDDLAAALELTRQARSLQSDLVDPYFEMMFVLLEGSGELMRMALELHRNQYATEFRAARVGALTQLAQTFRKLNNPGAAIPLLDEAADLQRKAL